MAQAGVAMGHTVYMIGVGELTYHPDGQVGGMARSSPGQDVGSTVEFLQAVQGRDAERERISSRDLDVLYLRYNAEENSVGKPWDRDSGIVFGQIAVQQGVLVLNDPDTLAYATNKMYLQHFPEAVRPRTLISRSPTEIREFFDEQNGRVVLKPLRGYGGADVYLLDGDATNLRSLVESIGRSSYVIAQEYLPAAENGDTRLFLVNGRPLQCEGKYAAVRRVNRTEDFRGNMTAGAKPEKAQITDEILALVEQVRPKLLADGLFEVGVDIVGDKLVEINTISAGGLNAASKLEGVNFGEAVIQAIERKVHYRSQHSERFSNRELAVME
jgi:glutathione synthase